MDKYIYKRVTKALLILSTVSLVSCGGDDNKSSSGSLTAEEAYAASCLVSVDWVSSTSITVTNSCNYAVNAYFTGTNAVKMGILGRKTVRVNLGGGDAFRYAACRQPYHPHTSNGDRFVCSPNP